MSRQMFFNPSEVSRNTFTCYVRSTISNGLEQTNTHISVRESRPYVFGWRTSARLRLISGGGKIGVWKRSARSHSCRQGLNYLDAAFPNARLDFACHLFQSYFIHKCTQKIYFQSTIMAFSMIFACISAKLVVWSLSS